MQNEKISLIQPRQSPKMGAIYGALQEGWPNARINSHEYDRVVLWGLIGDNRTWMERVPFTFVDMPYHGRLQGENYERSFWRWAPNSLHDTRQLSVPSDRFDAWECTVKPYKTDGEYILICPSSETMTRHLHGMGVEEWVEKVFQETRKYTNKPCKVRLKPRKNGTSGPSVADVPLEADLAGASALITSASLTAIDALIAGVPVFGTSDQCPAAWCTNRDLSKINTPVLFDREHLMYNLAYKQFSISEMRNGILYETQCRLAHNQS